ncbi:KilA-N domain-containing protein [Colletotrichum musicola]|uniref:KilA-N domain-containing protein n=1 Tax=Colletotrichum musicola TaxID=2175873 RepID=A0A8H6JIS1_9PEZI|nr:KilA-N domain-containing protein [Colletotrichum musicola]
MAEFKTLSSTIPRLLGESNWAQWLVLIGATLRANKVKKYVDSDVPEPADTDARATWESGRDVAYNLLITASELQINKLLNAGWEDDGDPHALMEALRKYIPKVSEDAVGALVDEFAKGDAGDHKTLHDALQRTQYLRKRIGDLCGSVSDHFWSIMLLNYFKQRLPDTYKHFTNRNQKPTWAEVIETIYTLAQDEEQKMGLTSYKKAASNTASSSASSTSGNRRKEDKASKLCDHCGKTHDTKTCYLAHPDHIPADHKYRESILKRSREHVCDKTCKWDAKKEATQTSVFVRGTSGALGQSALAGVAVRSSPIAQGCNVVSQAVLSAVGREYIERDDIILDSGCTTSIFNSLDLFTEYREQPGLSPFTAADGNLIRPEGTGTVFF